MMIKDLERELKKLDSNFYIEKSLNHHNIIFYKCVKRGVYDIDANQPFDFAFRGYVYNQMKQLVYEYWLSCLYQCSEEKTDRATEVAVIRKDYDMENIIPMKRRQVKDFLDTYTIKFLRKHNFLKINEKVSFSLIANNHIVFIAVVKTKYGYMAVGENNLVTYVGDGIWSVAKNG